MNIDSVTGEVEVIWGDAGSYDPIKAMKLPNVIKAIGRGMAPKAALRLFEDQHFSMRSRQTSGLGVFLKGQLQYQVS